MLDLKINPSSVLPYTQTGSTFMIQLKTGTAIISSDGVGVKGYQMQMGEVITLYPDEQYYFVNSGFGASTVALFDNKQ